MHVIGLDWVSTAKGWACCRLEIDSPPLQPSLSLLELHDIESSPFICSAPRIVIDIPIGLSTNCKDGCVLRPCDKGAKVLIGPDYQSSVFPVPMQGELYEWRDRNNQGLAQRQGHFRGLLPAINSAEKIVNAYPERCLESHPEVVFAVLAGQPLPQYARKNTLLGMLVRLALLKRAGVIAVPQLFEKLPPVPTDNYIDAMAMALVAYQWHIQGDIPLIREASGHSETLSSCMGLHKSCMAIPFDQIPPADFTQLIGNL